MTGTLGTPWLRAYAREDDTGRVIADLDPLFDADARTKRPNGLAARMAAVIEVWPDLVGHKEASAPSVVSS